MSIVVPFNTRLLSLFGFCCVHVNIRILFSSSVNNVIVILKGTALNLKVVFRSMAILTK